MVIVIDSRQKRVLSTQQYRYFDGSHPLLQEVCLNLCSVAQRHP